MYLKIEIVEYFIYVVSCYIILYYRKLHTHTHAHTHLEIISIDYIILYYVLGQSLMHGKDLI